MSPLPEQLFYAETQIGLAVGACKSVINSYPKVVVGGFLVASWVGDWPAFIDMVRFQVRVAPRAPPLVFLEVCAFFLYGQGRALRVRCFLGRRP